MRVPSQKELQRHKTLKMKWLFITCAVQHVATAYQVYHDEFICHFICTVWTLSFIKEVYNPRSNTRQWNLILLIHLVAPLNLLNNSWKALIKQLKSTDAGKVGRNAPQTFFHWLLLKYYQLFPPWSHRFTHEYEWKFSLTIWNLRGIFSLRWPEKANNNLVHLHL